MVRPVDVTWEVLKDAQPALDDIRKSMQTDQFEDDRKALQEYLCEYFNSAGGKDCIQKQGRAISPVGFPTGPGGKCLKVRWGTPGGGKSGGLRLAVVVYCAEKRVKFAGAWMRADGPSDKEFEEALERG